MRISQTIFKYKFLSCNFFITDNSNTNDSFKAFYVSNSSAYLNYSMYLSFLLTFEDEETNEKITESFVISFFDMFKFKSMINNLIEILTSDFYEEYEHIEKGLMLRIKPEFKKVIKMTNTTKTSQIGFFPKILYRRKEDFYYPAIRVFINRDDLSIDIPVDNFLSILYNIKDIDMHLYATNLLNSYLNNKLVAKQAYKKYSSAIKEN
ncbi:MAG: hypothetical protein [Bacteriophage sp.]|nr:MAG: hypothetical protein [Bacteriophage sp.]